MTMSDRIAVMDKGRIAQIADPETIYRRPASTFIADFIGTANFLDAVVLTQSGSGGANVKVLGRTATVPAADSVSPGKAAVLLVRPEELRLTPATSLGPTAAEVTRIAFHGERTEYELDSPEGRLIASVAGFGGPALARGDLVNMSFDPERTWLLPKDDVTR